MSHRNPDDTDRHIGAEGTEAVGETRRRSGDTMAAPMPAPPGAPVCSSVAISVRTALVRVSLSTRPTLTAT